MPQGLPKHRAREYETLFIVNPESTAETMDQVATRLTDVVGRLDGKILRAENWGKRKLGYPVKKHEKGTYIYLRYLGYSDLVHELERNMRMMEPVLKYLTVKIDEDVDPEARPVREEDVSFAPLYDEDSPRSDYTPAETDASVPEKSEPVKEQTAAEDPTPADTAVDAVGTESAPAESAAAAPAEPAAEPAAETVEAEAPTEEAGETTKEEE